MKKKEITEFKNKPLAELEKFVRDSKEKLRTLKFDLAAGKVKNVKDLRMLKKDIARALTFIKDKADNSNA
ncbi:MAG: 50S ribosomal protein L29 [bacterium]|nr:50S ribosomal protein L29 [bacterium]